MDVRNQLRRAATHRRQSAHAHPLTTQPSCDIRGMPWEELRTVIKFKSQRACTRNRIFMHITHTGMYPV